MNSHPLRPTRRSLLFTGVLYHNLGKYSNELIVNRNNCLYVQLHTHGDGCGLIYALVVSRFSEHLSDEKANSCFCGISYLHEIVEIVRYNGMVK